MEDMKIRRLPEPFLYNSIARLTKTETVLWPLFQLSCRCPRDTNRGEHTFAYFSRQGSALVTRQVDLPSHPASLSACLVCPTSTAVGMIHTESTLGTTGLGCRDPPNERGDARGFDDSPASGGQQPDTESEASRSPCGPDYHKVEPVTQVCCRKSLQTEPRRFPSFSRPVGPSYSYPVEHMVTNLILIWLCCLHVRFNFGHSE
ncbi:unnamed protein product [Protopolystoma xenopodis]|uniref:Uncharacterized protein n=1 Tax=Protopolystoma xenopodis TaxID=117903 RepID=A0A448WH48_9PLAT|nr:unnamed protein product [Protopolystoma xenopodis]